MHKKLLMRNEFIRPGNSSTLFPTIDVLSRSFPMCGIHRDFDHELLLIWTRNFSIHQQRNR